MATCAQGLAAELAVLEDDGLLNVLVLVCVMHAVTWPVLVLALLARDVPRRDVAGRDVPRRAPSMSALGRRFSRSDSALFESYSMPARPPPAAAPARPRTSPVFARMLANTREAPPRPRWREGMERSL